MSFRRGQVAVYLVAVVLALTVLVVMNVSIFLSVRAKNRAMNAGDAAALAVAKYQGELLNQIGADNIEHLKAALEGDEDKCAEIMESQRRTCFLSPMEGIRIGNEAAIKNGVTIKAGEDVQRILRDHIMDIRLVFANNTEMYPEPWEGAWEEYASRLEIIVGALGDGLVVGPDNIEFADAWESFPLMDRMFYEAIAGRNWCWFHFNGEWLFDRDSRTMPKPNFEDPEPRCDSEIYPLHIDFRPLSQSMKSFIEEATGCTPEDIAKSNLLFDPEQKWAYFDRRWRRWYEMDPLNDDGLPIVGRVRHEYDVLGCAAVCRVMSSFADLVDGGSGSVVWTAAAKPFGTVENPEGEIDVVTVFNDFVVPAFSNAKLVPVDSVGGWHHSTADYDWVLHVKKHLPEYFAKGPYAVGLTCFYCKQLRRWENPMFRARGKAWLKYNSDTCIRPTGSSAYRGGTAHGH